MIARHWACQFLMIYWLLRDGAPVVIFPTTLGHDRFTYLLLRVHFSAHSTVVDNHFGVEIGVMERFEICKLEYCVEHIILCIIIIY